MLTRHGVTRQYGEHAAGDYAPPPHHVHMPGQMHAPRMSRLQLHAAGGIMGGGAVTLGARGWTGSVLGDTGYGYLGMDPSAPSTWPRPFSPAPGMIAWLNFYGTGQASG
jgi:hypothetical protein